jgi:hypothetical protein
MTSDEKCQKEGLVTRKLLLTAAIVALALAPSIGAGTAQAHGFYRGGFGRGFHSGFGRGFYGGFGGFYPGYYRYGYFPYGYYR